MEPKHEVRTGRTGEDLVLSSQVQPQPADTTG